MSLVNKKPIGGLGGGLDPTALARAEAALKALSGQFAGWLDDEVDKLEQARARVVAEGLGGSAGEVLYTRAHDLKGLGATYGFPIISRLAASLCRLIESGDSRTPAATALVESHVNAIKVMVRDDIRHDSHPIGAAICMALEEQVAPRP